MLATIEDSGRQLNRFAVNLLDAGRLEAGSLVLNRDWWEVDDLFGAVLDRIDEETCARVTLDVAAGLPLLYLDFALMERVFANLLDNARKYSPPETPIEISAHERDGRVVLEVTNTISGPAPDPARLFERFYRADDRPDAQGTGLGLSICKGFVEAQGGTIAARADGAAMTIALTFAIAEAGRRFAAEFADE